MNNKYLQRDLVLDFGLAEAVVYVENHEACCQKRNEEECHFEGDFALFLESQNFVLLWLRHFYWLYLLLSQRRISFDGLRDSKNLLLGRHFLVCAVFCLRSVNYGWIDVEVVNFDDFNFLLLFNVINVLVGRHTIWVFRRSLSSDFTPCQVEFKVYVIKHAEVFHTGFWPKCLKVFLVL